MQLAMSSIDLLQTGGDPAVEDAKSRTMWFTGIGTAGPAVVGGAMLMLNKIALALFIGFSPFFILCLLFDFTKGLFQKWLFYGVGTMFSLAVLSAMVSIATEMVTRVAAYYWAGNLLSSLTGMSSEGLSSMSMQQGGIGFILTIMLVSAPPMAAAFFNGVMGQFSGFNTFTGGGAVGPGARGPGSPPSQSQAPANTRYERDYAETRASDSTPGRALPAEQILGARQAVGQPGSPSTIGTGEMGAARNQPIVPPGAVNPTAPPVQPSQPAQPPVLPPPPRGS